LPPSRQTRPSGHIAPARRITRRAQPKAEDTSLGTPVRPRCRQLPILPGLYLTGGGSVDAPACAVLFQHNMTTAMCAPITSKIGTRLTDAAIVAHISRLPHSRANFKQLVRELGSKGEGRNELEAALTRLTARGDLIELKSGQYVVTTHTREFAVGRLNLHRDGYGFLISERPIPGISGDIFISPEAAEKAMHG